MVQPDETPQMPESSQSPAEPAATRMPAAPVKPPLSRREKMRDFAIGFFGWWLVNILLWYLIDPTPNVVTVGYSGSGYINLLILPANVVVLIVLAIVRRWVGLGILAAFVVNLIVSLIMGIGFNAFCWIPFTRPYK